MPNCSDPIYVLSIKNGIHGISKDDFDGYVLEYNLDESQPDISHYRPQFQKWSELDCDDYYLQPDGDELKEKQGKPTSGVDNDVISIAVVRGLLLDAPFHKLEIWRIGEQLTYRAVDYKNAAFYWGNATNLFPPPPLA